MRKRMKVFAAVLIIFAMVASSIVSAYAEPREGMAPGRAKQIARNFEDVEQGFWAYQAISDLASRGIINGYTDGTFKPNATVTRAEFATMLVKALDLTSTGSGQTFADVAPSDWDYTAVEAAHLYLTGYQKSNGTLYFYGSQNAVREDMAVALVKALNLTVVSNNGQLQQVFKDYANISPNLVNYVYTAYVDGIMVGATGGRFAPQGNLTRAEAATLLERALQKTEKVVVDGSGDTQKVPVDGSGQTSTYDTDATLSALTYNGTTVPGFTANTTAYTVALPAGTTAVPVVTAAVNDTGKATAYITQATALPGVATVVVLAQDGVTQKTYTISFTAAAALDTDASLSTLAYNGTTVPGFTANTAVYTVALPAGTTAVPVVTAAVNDTGKATAYVTQATALPGVATVVVLAQDGVTQKTYTISFTVAAALDTDASLSNLWYNGTQVAGFNAATTAYNVVLPHGTTTVPAVTAVVNDTGKATDTITQAAALPGIATVVVTAQDGTTRKVYTISFTVAAPDTDATLNLLEYNGIAVPGFSANTTSYSVVLPAGTAAIPTVTAGVTDAGKATAYVTQAQALPGVASVVVTAQDGTTQKVYTVSFTVAAS